MFLEEERFLEGLWAHGMFRAEDIAGKECLIIGGMYFWEKNYSVTLNDRLMDMGAARCDNMVLFSYLVLESFCDLTDVEEVFVRVFGKFKRSADRVEKSLSQQELRKNFLHCIPSNRMRMCGAMMWMICAPCSAAARWRQRHRMMGSLSVHCSHGGRKLHHLRWIPCSM